MDSGLVLHACRSPVVLFYSPRTLTQCVLNARSRHLLSLKCNVKTHYTQENTLESNMVWAYFNIYTSCLRYSNLENNTNTSFSSLSALSG